MIGTTQLWPDGIYVLVVMLVRLWLPRFPFVWREFGI